MRVKVGEDGACGFEVCKFLVKNHKVSCKDHYSQENCLTCAHDPFTILTNPDAVTCLLKLEILEQFDSVRIFGIVLETALSPSRKPFW